MRNQLALTRGPSMNKNGKPENLIKKKFVLYQTMVKVLMCTT